jgi:hypothetical protein
MSKRAFDLSAGLASMGLFGKKPREEVRKKREVEEVEEVRKRVRAPDAAYQEVMQEPVPRQVVRVDRDLIFPWGKEGRCLFCPFEGKCVRVTAFACVACPVSEGRVCRECAPQVEQAAACPLCAELSRLF